MLQKRFAVLVAAIGMFCLSAKANFLTATAATANCQGYSLTVGAADLVPGVTYTINYSFTVTCGSAAPRTIPGSITFVATDTTATETATGTFGGMSGNCTVSGTATLTNSGSTVMIGVNGENNGAPAPLTCTTATPQLTVTKTADSATVKAGATAGFTVTISNPGTVADTGVTLTDPLPAGSGGDINWQIDASTGTPGCFTITGSVGSQSLNLVCPTMNPGGFLNVHITGLTHADDTGTTAANPVLNVGGVSGYTVLYEGTGGHNLQITNVSIAGNIGVGGTGHVQYNGPGTIGGRIDFSAANTGQYSNNNGSNIGPTSVNYNVAAVTGALDQINMLSQSLGELGGTSLALNGNMTINESDGTLQTAGGFTYRVFNVTSYSENDGKVVTINGDGSGNPVVLNFGFNSNVNLGGDVVLTGGLTPDEVIWNFPTSGKNINLNNNASSFPFPADAFQGVILAPNDNLSVVNSSLIGRVLGGDTGDMQIVSGDNIHTPPESGSLVNTATVSASNVASVSATATITID